MRYVTRSHTHTPYTVGQRNTPYLLLGAMLTVIVAYAVLVAYAVTLDSIHKATHKHSRAAIVSNTR